MMILITILYSRYQVIGCSRFYQDFQLDPMGFPLVDYIPALSYGWEIPRYPYK